MNKEAKILLENFISLSSLQILGMLLPLVTLPYVIRTIGFDNYGLIILASSLVAYFQSVTDYSFRITATRDVAVFRESPKEINLIYSKVLMVKAVFLILSFFFLTIIIIVYPPFYKEKIVFFLTVPMLLGYALFPEWFFQGIEKMKYITILNLSIKVFFTICVFIFIKKETDYWIYPLLQSIGSIGVGIIGQFILIKKYKLKFIWLPIKTIKESIVSNFPIFVNQFMPTLYNNSSSFLLGILTTTNLLGVYDTIKKVVDLAVALLNIVSRVFFPFLNRKKEAFQRYKTLIFLLSVGLTLGCIISYPLVFWYLNITYENALYVLCVLAVGILGLGMYDVFGVNYFVIKREDKIVMMTTIYSSIFGFILAFPLIYFFGIIGAAINLTFCRFLMGGQLFYKWKKYETKCKNESQELIKQY
ncbi:MAG TPA: oligosaccharide flippase family protein [Flavobacterium sp.]|uniref:oligosaccharide flippase family protein n=1 Tax=Flavobacterium sp. TaxID=239 RepID=UPI002DB70CA7|nr:oligosaccharide flippase family protein [Flavobacterium sp.]HEU4788945.1 oligosaccharide flippase family protein [Flavobacterium sp.]